MKATPDVSRSGPACAVSCSMDGRPHWAQSTQTPCVPRCCSWRRCPPSRVWRLRQWSKSIVMSSADTKRCSASPTQRHLSSRWTLLLALQGVVKWHVPRRCSAKRTAPLSGPSGRRPPPHWATTTSLRWSLRTPGGWVRLNHSSGGLSVKGGRRWAPGTKTRCGPSTTLRCCSTTQANARRLGAPTARCTGAVARCLGRRIQRPSRPRTTLPCFWQVTVKVLRWRQSSCFLLRSGAWRPNLGRTTCAPQRVPSGLKSFAVGTRPSRRRRCDVQHVAFLHPARPNNGSRRRSR
mmetsp:Transcript_80520/g.260925  ORF Transcript_80520/g.260925 Transcript_80520/m.260925 type:complete len:292 (+) Transcript_80520:1271-2146(+)